MDEPAPRSNADAGCRARIGTTPVAARPTIARFAGGLEATRRLLALEGVNAA